MEMQNEEQGKPKPVTGTTCTRQRRIITNTSSSTSSTGRLLESGESEVGRSARGAFVGDKVRTEKQ